MLSITEPASLAGNPSSLAATLATGRVSNRSASVSTAVGLGVTWVGLRLTALTLSSVVASYVFGTTLEIAKTAAGIGIRTARKSHFRR